MEVIAQDENSLWKQLNELPELDIVYSERFPEVYSDHLDSVLKNPPQAFSDGKNVVEAPNVIYFCAGAFKYHENEVFSSRLKIFFDMIFLDIRRLAENFKIVPLIEKMKRDDLIEINIPLKKDDSGERHNLGIAYVFIDDPLIVALIFGNNIDGSKRRERIEDPNWNNPDVAAKREVTRAALIKTIAAYEQQISELNTPKDFDFATMNWADFEDEDIIKSKNNKVLRDLEAAQQQLKELDDSTILRDMEPLIALPKMMDHSINPSGEVIPFLGSLRLEFIPDEPTDYTLFCRLKNFTDKPLTFTLQEFADKFTRYSAHEGYPKLSYVSIGDQNVVVITFAPNKCDVKIAYEMNRFFKAPWNPNVTLILHLITSTAIDETIFKCSRGQHDPDAHVVTSLNARIQVKKYVEKFQVMSSRGRYDTRGGSSTWREPRAKIVDSDGFEVIPATSKTRGRGRGR